MMERAAGALELFDQPVTASERAATLADIDRLSAWFRGYALTIREIQRLAATRPADGTLVLIDVGGAHAAFAARLVDWARRIGRAIRVVVVERDPDSLALARRVSVSYPEIRLVRGDATALPVREAAADAVMASLTLHHLEPDAAVCALREMAAAGRAIVINDLLRTRLSLAQVWLVTRLLRCHPISRHDGPLSVRRAYSSAELRELVEKAGIGRLVIHEYPMYGRLVAVTG